MIARRLPALIIAIGVTAVTADAQSTLVADVRAAIAKNDFAAAEALVETARVGGQLTPVGLEAKSWLGRGALAAGRLDEAMDHAVETHELVLEALKTRQLASEPSLVTALGAAIEVQGQAAAQQGQRALAVQFLRKELATYSAPPELHKRIAKNVNLLSLEGAEPPPLDLSEFLGTPTAPALSALKGKVVLLFFWAHWCSDCKIQGPILASLLDRYGSQGLTIVAPTQRFGYAAGGARVGPQEERQYIEQVRDTHYAFLRQYAVPLAEQNHRTYGVSSTPTLVLIGRDGRIARYQPGRLPEDQLESLIVKLLSTRG